MLLSQYRAGYLWMSIQAIRRRIEWIEFNKGKQADPPTKNKAGPSQTSRASSPTSRANES